MRSIAIGFLIGALIVLSGLLVIFTAPGLAISWQSVHTPTWIGAMDVAQELLDQLLGIGVIGFGLYMMTIAYLRWRSRFRGSRPVNTGYSIHRMRSR